MRAQFLSLAGLLMWSGALHARLGETMEECAGRYGPLIEMRHAEPGTGDADVAVFSKSAVTILVEFHEGKAWHITFHKPVLTALETEALLKADAGNGEWGSPFKLGDRDFKMSADGQRLAVIFATKPSALATMEVMTREYVQKRRDLQLSSQRAGAPEKMKVKSNPLPGF